MDGKLDENWVRAPELASIFKAAEGSRLRTSLPPLRWLEKNYGTLPARNILRFLKIPQNVIANPNQPVKLRLLFLVLRAMAARGLPDEAFFKMGLSAFEIPENQGVRAQLEKIRSPKEIYEWFFTEAIVQFEMNYNYRIVQARPNSITLSITPKEGRIEENGVAVTGDRYLSIYRWGVASGLTRWINLPVAQARQIHAPTAHTPIEQVVFSWDSRHAARSSEPISAGSANRSTPPSLRLV